MSTPIINKVAESGLISLDLASFLPQEEIVLLDLKQFLFMELIVKEKEFRAALLSFDWTVFQNKIVAIFCSNDSIIPMWANMLVASALNGIARSVYFGNIDKVREQILLEKINQLKLSDYLDQRVVIKGCGEIEIKEAVYVAITNVLRPVVKSIMYGEPCSTVPVYKKK